MLSTRLTCSICIANLEDFLYCTVYNICDIPSIKYIYLKTTLSSCYMKFLQFYLFIFFVTFFLRTFCTTLEIQRFSNMLSSTVFPFHALPKFLFLTQHAHTLNILITHIKMQQLSSTFWFPKMLIHRVPIYREKKSLMAQWLRRASQGYEMYWPWSGCHGFKSRSGWTWDALYFWLRSYLNQT